MPWTGVGARVTPLLIQKVMTLFASTMETLCRHGFAEGADQAFGKGAQKQEIYLPWRGFNGHKTGMWDYTEAQIMFAEYLAWKVYPVVIPDNFMKLFRRNAFQIVGLSTCVEDVKPSSFVMCWTPDGCIGRQTYNYGTTGGTGVAILIAEEFEVPVYNLARPEHMRMVLSHLNDHGIKTVKLEKDLRKQGLFA